MLLDIGEQAGLAQIALGLHGERLAGDGGLLLGESDRAGGNDGVEVGVFLGHRG